jgi:mono/diheme cytochrome c family protein
MPATGQWAGSDGAVMKRIRTLFALVVLAGVGAVTGCSTQDDVGTAVAIEPAVLYARMCARCHGADGRGDPEIRKTMPNVRDFHDPAFRARATTDAIVSIVMAGKGQMPAFANSLSLPKMQALSGYVRRLGGVGGPSGAAP